MKLCPQSRDEPTTRSPHQATLTTEDQEEFVDAVVAPLVAPLVEVALAVALHHA